VQHPLGEVNGMRQRGFSLIELLIVVAIILIIAAIAIPNLVAARMRANEASAVATVRTIDTAELTYSQSYPTVGYAVRLLNLGGAQPCNVPTSTSACLVPDPVSTAAPGTNGKNGYFFVAIGSSSISAANDQFVVGAAPTSPNVTGIRLFCSTHDNVARWAAGPSSTPVSAVSACVAYLPI
jgi:prepilin-type N-terminal cleavage/methylation domain-containing protein